MFGSPRFHHLPSFRSSSYFGMVEFVIYKFVSSLLSGSTPSLLLSAVLFGFALARALDRIRARERAAATSVVGFRGESGIQHDLGR